MTNHRKTPTREVWMYVKDPDKLRRRRRDKKLSQKQLAALCDCTQQYISLLENGDDRDCSEKIAEKICRWLDLGDLEDYFEVRQVIRTPKPPTSSRVSGDAA